MERIDIRNIVPLGRTLGSFAFQDGPIRAQVCLLVESEGRRIWDVNAPKGLWTQLRVSTLGTTQ
jgi:hypothetical protein